MQPSSPLASHGPEPQVPSIRSLQQLERLGRVLRSRPAELRSLVELAMWFHWRATGEPGIHLFHGGHVRLHDAKRFYRSIRAYASSRPGVRGWWAGRRGGSRRWSQTHPTEDEPFELTLPVRWGCILAGTHPAGSWFQAEATSVKRGVLPLVYHNLVDFLAYRLSGRQQGPLGSSRRTDRDPLVLADGDCVEGLRIFRLP